MQILPKRWKILNIRRGLVPESRLETLRSSSGNLNSTKCLFRTFHEYYSCCGNPFPTGFPPLLIYGPATGNSRGFYEDRYPTVSLFSTHLSLAFSNDSLLWGSVRPTPNPQADGQFLSKIHECSFTVFTATLPSASTSQPQPEDTLNNSSPDLSVPLEKSRLAHPLKFPAWTWRFIT
jgi:hypothetical protein